MRSDIGVDLYMREIGRIPLLTRNQEYNLACVYRGLSGLTGSLVFQNDNHPFEEYRRGKPYSAMSVEEAADLLTRANRRLVVSIAKSYRKSYIDFLDLIAEGEVGLVRAVKKYDPETGNRFSTYATWWIRQAVKMAAADARAIHLPSNIAEILPRFNNAYDSLIRDLGRKPTNEEISDKMGLEESSVLLILDARTARSRRMISLDKAFDDAGKNLYGSLEDEEVLQPDQILGQGDAGRLLNNLMGALTPKERYIIESHSGVNGREEKKLRELGKEFGVSYEAIRQIEAKAIKKLERAAKDPGFKNDQCEVDEENSYSTEEIRKMWGFGSLAAALRHVKKSGAKKICHGRYEKGAIDKYEASFGLYDSSPENSITFKEIKKLFGFSNSSTSKHIKQSGAKRIKPRVYEKLPILAYIKKHMDELLEIDTVGKDSESTVTVGDESKFIVIVGENLTTTTDDINSAKPKKRYKKPAIRKEYNPGENVLSLKKMEELIGREERYFYTDLRKHGLRNLEFTLGYVAGYLDRMICRPENREAAKDEFYAFLKKRVERKCKIPDDQKPNRMQKAT